MNKQVKELYNAIPLGKENAIHQEELSLKLNMSKDKCKRLIKQARHEGLPILSGVHGYWRAENNEEIQRFITSMQRQALSRFDSAGSLRSKAETLTGQIKLDLKSL